MQQCDNEKCNNEEKKNAIYLYITLHDRVMQRTL